RPLLSEARALIDQGRGWRLGAFDVALAWVRLVASEPVADRTAIARALESLDVVTAELGSDPYRRIAALERARLAPLPCKLHLRGECDEIHVHDLPRPERDGRDAGERDGGARRFRDRVRGGAAPERPLHRLERAAADRDRPDHPGQRR